MSTNAPSAPSASQHHGLLPAGVFHHVLRAAILRRGLTLDRIRARLARRGVPVALSTLSDWQHGRSRPERDSSLRAVAALEEILGLPRTALTSSLSMPVPPRAVGVDERGGPLAELLDALPGSRRRSFDIVTMQQKVLVGGPGARRSVLSRAVVRARHDGVDRHVVRCFGAPGSRIRDVSVRPLENCRLGRVLRHPEQPVLIAELLFGQALPAGATWVYEWQVLGGPDRCTDHAFAFRTAADQYLLEVRFPLSAGPRDCWSYSRPALDASATRLGTLTLNRHHAVHLAAANVAAGVLGIAWTWPPDQGPGRDRDPGRDRRPPP